VVVGGVVVAVVRAEHDGDVLVLGGRGDDDLLRAAVEWALALSASVKKPVDSMTTSAPSSFHGRSPGRAPRAPGSCAADDDVWSS
jgi:hypothetical protein